MPLVQGFYSTTPLPAIDHVVRDPGPSPSPSPSPVYARASTEPATPSSNSDLAVLLTEMLRRGEARATALVQTLVANRSTSGLMSAFERDPSLVNASVLLTLAECNARQEFGAAVHLRPEVVTPDFLLELGERKSSRRWLALALQARPDLEPVPVTGARSAE